MHHPNYTQEDVQASHREHWSMAYQDNRTPSQREADVQRLCELAAREMSLFPNKRPRDC